MKTDKVEIILNDIFHVLSLKLVTDINDQIAFNDQIVITDHIDVNDCH